MRGRHLKTAGNPRDFRTVKNLEVSLDKKTVTVTYDPAKTDVTKLKAALEKLGYKVKELSGKA